ncbi:hypothetical protein BDN71DRAFT_1500436 [Pleurotus eryngii]|uniref:Thioredoxin domain-containing protein n=1 Tax=Pleurotus eryngii TaxID=5323 RepID=A0A9P6DKG9_PLEER|nr:hypothetical protein BDN71DRAFT_1500436 [Pleurotus eryngii]
MPLDSKDFPDPSSLLEKNGERFLIFYSSIVDGQLWCPDCRVVDELIKTTFLSEDAPHGIVIYVGDRATYVASHQYHQFAVDITKTNRFFCAYSWKNSGNKYHGAPFNVTSIPTIIKVVDSKEVARLVDPNITAQSLPAFVQQKD